MAGAIQDNDRGTIVGRRSFGKGLVQREMDFDDGSAVRLTIARYYTPTGRSIQKPYSKGNEDYLKESELRFKNGELYHKDSIKTPKHPNSKPQKAKLSMVVAELFLMFLFRLNWNQAKNTRPIYCNRDLWGNLFLSNWITIEMLLKD